MSVLACKREVTVHTWWRGCQRRCRRKKKEKKKKKALFAGWVRTSQIKVARSCHGAFLGRSARAAVDATSAMPATPAREYADVAVKTDGACVDSSIVVSVSDSGEISGEGWQLGATAGGKTSRWFQFRCSSGTRAYRTLCRHWHFRRFSPHSAPSLNCTLRETIFF